MRNTILEKRLIFVTGKGGVGKSTVAMTLGLAAARRGKRVIVAELAGNDESQRAFGLPGDRHFVEVRLAKDLFTISIDPQSAMDEYMRVKLPGPTGAALSQSKLFSAFAMATPGMQELLSMGKVWELSQLERRTPEADGYDIVILDAPASGHGVGILRTPRMFAELAKVGPIANQSTRIAKTIADRSFTGIVAVTTPEEMPVNEIFQVREELAQDRLGLDAIVVNGRYPDRFDDADMKLLNRALTQGGSKPDESPLSNSPQIAAAISEHERRATQLEQEQRLDASFEQLLLHLPFLFVAAIDQHGIATLATDLDEQLA